MFDVIDVWMFPSPNNHLAKTKLCIGYFELKEKRDFFLSFSRSSDALLPLSVSALSFSLTVPQHYGMLLLFGKKNTTVDQRTLVDVLACVLSRFLFVLDDQARFLLSLYCRQDSFERKEKRTLPEVQEEKNLA